jgi:transcriptional regulator with XRE-family HTH domain
MMNPIKQIRVSRGMSQADIADKLDITQASYARIEQGQTKLSLDRIAQLATIFDVSQSYFLTEDNGYNAQDLEMGVINEYVKQIVAINKDLREVIIEQMNKRIASLEQQNQQLLDMLSKKVNQE